MIASSLMNRRIRLNVPPHHVLPICAVGVGKFDQIRVWALGDTGVVLGPFYKHQYAVLPVDHAGALR